MTTGSAMSAAQVADLYLAYAPALRRYLERLTGNRETAEDLVQETFIKALRHRAQLASPDGAHAWLFRIAQHSAFDEFRRQRRRLALPLREELVAGSGTQEEPAVTSAPVNAALAQLSDCDRRLLLLRGYAGYSLNDIGALMGLNEGTVKSRLSRARARFRRAYQRVEPAA